MRLRIVATFVAVSALTLLATTIGWSGHAHAAPAKAPGAITFLANCGADGTVEVVINSSNNGKWAPAFVTGTNQVFIPTAFGPFVGTFTAPDGTVFPINEPAASKASPQNGAHILNCSFHIDFFDRNGGHVVADGSGTGFLTPVN